MKRFIKADEELSEYFTTSIGLKGQSYEPSSSQKFNPYDEDGRNRGWDESRALYRYAELDATFRALDFEARDLLRAVYGHGAGALHEDAKSHEGLTIGANNSPDRLGLLKIALLPNWGHGSFVRIATWQDRALRGYAKKHPGSSPSPGAVMEYLAFEAGRGSETKEFFARLRDECESAREAALAIYDEFRIERVRGATKRRQSALDDLLGRQRKKETAAFERKIARLAS